MKRNIIPYDPRLVPIARDLRNNSTLPQILLWLELKGKKMRGYHFHRQKPILSYILDFFCHELMLGIELVSEFPREERQDELKLKKLTSLGITMLEFSDHQVLKNRIDVLAAIDDYVSKFKKHTPNPSQEGS